MLVNKDKAELIVELSFKLYEYKKYDQFFTLNKAMELNDDIADKIIVKMNDELKQEHMKEEVNSYGASIYHADTEIVVVDNYKYVDYIDYDVFEKGIKSKEIRTIRCKMIEGDQVEILSNSLFYAPHIYGNIIKYSKIDEPIIKDTSLRELYLKLLIVEDRLVNPYITTENCISGTMQKIIIPMKEALDKYKGYDKEINLLNDLLKVCNGKIISSREIGGFADIGIKPTVLYLESIGEEKLANEIRMYQNDPLYLNVVLDWARKGYYGLAFNGINNKVHLI